MAPTASSSPRIFRLRPLGLISLLVAAMLAMLAPLPASAGYLGRPDADTPLYTFENGFNADWSQRAVYVAAPSNILIPTEVTFKTTRYLVRESYGLGRLFSFPVNVDALFGISLADIDFGRVDMQDGGNFWCIYAPGTTPCVGTDGPSFRELPFGQSYGASYGLAINAQLFEWKGGRVGVGAQVLQSASTDTSLPAMRLRYNEWDAFIGSMHTGPNLGFYYGANLSALKGEVRMPTWGVDLEEKSMLGIYAGMTYHFYRNLSFGTELRIMNQLSYSLRVNYHFN